MATYMAIGRICADCGEWVPMMEADIRAMQYGRWLCKDCLLLLKLGERDIG